MKLNFLHFKEKTINNDVNLLGNVRRHWYWFLGIFSISFIVVVAVSLGFVGRLDRFDSEPTSSVVMSETINRIQLDKVLKFFEDKTVATEVLLKNPPAVVDPAL